LSRKTKDKGEEESEEILKSSFLRREIPSDYFFKDLPFSLKIRFLGTVKPKSKIDRYSRDGLNRVWIDFAELKLSRPMQRDSSRTRSRAPSRYSCTT